MQVFHPAQGINGQAPENCFVVADSSGSTAGEGYLILTQHPYLFPDRPINIYMNLRCGEQGRDMLLGALMARAQQIRDAFPQQRARLFTQVNRQDLPMLNFYSENGFDQTDALDLVRIITPNARPSAPMGYDIGYVPLNNQAEIQGFLSRMNMYRLNAWSPTQLTYFQSFPHFFAVYISRGPDIVGEAVFTGNGPAAKLLGMYVQPNYRGLGIAKSMIAFGLKNLMEKGVTAVEANVIRRSDLQCALAASCSATFVRTDCYYPGLNYD